MAAFQPADSLRSRTFIGLLVAQFFAAFNDQAIHASAMFFAINTDTLDEGGAITLMPILFYAPWAIFCTLAGWLADRYSKRNSLVFWKVAEVAITLVALSGFALHNFYGSSIGPYLVLSTVFLMGMHSAFFVPAKYGVMPEILQPHLLSRGNGLLESLSFLAIILGTVCGGVLSSVFRSQEYLIGLVLVSLAVIGAVASLLIRKMPAANPTRPFPPYLYKPLWQNIRTLLGSRPLAFAVVGIAFFTFIVAFMRATVYMFGEVQAPRWDEAKTSLIVGMVALGIGLGSPLVGYLSGKKIELGLVPIGAVGMTAVTVAAALTLAAIPALIVCIVLIGFFTGFYIVPMFTLLQHRAPKASKGDSIATSNFINVTGAILASLVFGGMEYAARLTGVSPLCHQTEEGTAVLEAEPVYEHGRLHRMVLGDRVIEDGTNVRLNVIQPHGDGPVGSSRLYRQLAHLFSSEKLKVGDKVTETVFHRDPVTVHRFRLAGTDEVPAYDRRPLPRLLYLSAAAMTVFTLFVLWRLLPDLFLRTLLWYRWNRQTQLLVYGVHHLPGNGAAIIATNADTPDGCLQVVSAADRTVRFLLVEEGGHPRLSGLTQVLVSWNSLALVPSGGGPGIETLVRRAEAALHRKQVVGLSLNGHHGAKYGEQVLQCLPPMAVIVPVYCDVEEKENGRRRVSVVMGEVLPPGTSLPEIRETIQQVGLTFEEQKRSGTLAEISVGGH
jgi:MFS family permease